MRTTSVTFPYPVSLDHETEKRPVLTITPLQRVALQLLATGSTNDAVADRVGVHARDIDAWLADLFAKMGAASRTEALADAIRRGLVFVERG